MGKTIKPVVAMDVARHKMPSIYPKAFAHCVKGRHKRKLGDHFGLTNFGINLTLLEHGFQTALLHQHLKADEFVYVL